MDNHLIESIMRPIIQSILIVGSKVIQNRKVQIALVIILVIFIARGGIKKAFAAIRKGKFRRNALAQANRIAIAIKNAANPSGYNWLINRDGTKTTAFLDAVREAKNLDIVKEVARAYSLISDGETLTERAAEELDTDELRRFNDIIS